jgi:precorrin-6Y C5,15-methyltransferase (decarboxylating)
VPRLRVVVGSAPGVLADEQRPDAIFIGGGVSQVGVLPVTLAALPPGGRLVANAVTLAGERTLLAAHARLGGDLLRIDLAHAAPVGGMLAWRPALPLVQWSYVA